MLRFAAIVIFALAGLLGLGPDMALRVAERLPVADELPDGEALARLVRSCQITSEFGPEVALCPQALPANGFSQHLHSALIASEDRRFESHEGVDPVGIYRAVMGLVGLAGPSGGSTITQQLARTLLLSRDTSFDRKIREWILARRIERQMTKSEILTAYLNVAPQGHGLFGFEAAARYFLGKPARDLSVMESALLVSMLPLPTREPDASPLAAYQATIDRIALMESQGYVRHVEANRARQEAKRVILGHRMPEVSDAERLAARRPFEYRRLRDLAERQLADHGVEGGRAARIFVTLDPHFQSWADAATEGHPDGYEAAALFMSPTGDVLAVAGPRYGAVQYNAAFQATRSIGSLGKVPLYVLAHEKPGLLRRSYSTAPLKGRWPEEPSRRCSGDISLQRALAYSCNRPFTRLAGLMPSRARKFVAEMGLVAPNNPLLTALGGVHGNLLSVTGFFAAIANGGKLVEPRAVVAAVDRHGRTTWIEPERSSRQIMDARTARAVAADLRGPVTATGGTAWRAASPARAAHVAGKTGTSDGNRDAWFVGFTNDFVGGIWAYRTDDRAGPVSGGSYPAAAFGRIVDKYWVPKNAEAAHPARELAARAQGRAFGWSPSKLADRAKEGLRLFIAEALLLAALFLAWPWGALALLPSWHMGGRGEVAPFAWLTLALRG